MRISGGVHRSRQLVSPRGSSTRPTSDRVREALFSILDSRGVIAGARIIDFYAGTGALGLEALSRGAAFVQFVDDGIEARALLRQNVEVLGVAGTTRIFRRDATKLGAAHPVEPFGLAFADPPYGGGLAEKALASALYGGWLAQDALIVVEEAADAAFTAPDGLEEIERRRYDDSELIVMRRATVQTS